MEQNRLIVIGNFNARVGNNAVLGAVGVFEEQHRNSNGVSLINFPTSNDLKNT